jgi:hypothetical protein
MLYEYNIIYDLMDIGLLILFHGATIQNFPQLSVVRLMM